MSGLTGVLVNVGVVIFFLKVPLTYVGVGERIWEFVNWLEWEISQYSQFPPTKMLVHFLELLVYL